MKKKKIIYGKDFMKIKFNSDDNFASKQTIKASYVNDNC